MRLSYRQRPVVFALNKEKKISFAEKTIKDKQFVPGPATYDTTKGEHKITIGARRSYK
jgi:hypothetical protein